MKAIFHAWETGEGESRSIVCDFCYDHFSIDERKELHQIDDKNTDLLRCCLCDFEARNGQNLESEPVDLYMEANK